VPHPFSARSREQVREPEFRAISPIGMIPALGLADGRTVPGHGCETAYRADYATNLNSEATLDARASCLGLT
jgi:glutathione S-transferase